MPLEKRPSRGDYIGLGIAVLLAELLSLLPWIIAGEWIVSVIGLIFFPLCGVAILIIEHRNRVRRRTPWPPPEMFQGPSATDDWR